jgi:hypothetical protein
MMALSQGNILWALGIDLSANGHDLDRGRDGARDKKLETGT